jgi:alkanesulfonate monooxygenase SsuD/methylene tetrahydromethanopterin reductase-like flavin-dependent oxidoreductase (luciferase family)
VPPRLGVLLPTGPGATERDGPRRLVEFAVAAERAGLDSVWVNDSLLTPRIEALTTLAAVAVCTERVRLGTATLLPVLRRPVLTAQSLASIDRLSGGRLTVGVGAGYPGRFGRPLHALSEVPWADRFARLDETVALWRRLWTADGPFSFHGRFLHLDDVPPGTAPHAEGGPPVWLGGASPSALVRTGGAYDGWLPYPPDPDDYASGLAAVRDTAARGGRAAAQITAGFFATVRIDDGAAAGEALDAYTRAVYGMPVEQARTVQAMTAGPPEHVAAHLGRFVAAGAEHVVVRLAAADLAGQRDQLERLAGLVPQLAFART